MFRTFAEPKGGGWDLVKLFSLPAPPSSFTNHPLVIYYRPFQDGTSHLDSLFFLFLLSMPVGAFVPAQQIHNVKMTSFWCWCDVITSQRRQYDVMCLPAFTCSMSDGLFQLNDPLSGKELFKGYRACILRIAVNWWYTYFPFRLWGQDMWSDGISSCSLPVFLLSPCSNTDTSNRYIYLVFY